MTIFEKIIAREIPAYIIWEDDKHIAFLDIKPIQQGHILLIPKKAVSDILNMDDKEYSDLFLQAKKLALSLRTATGAKRVGYIVEGFGVEHVHIHLVPINGLNELDHSNASEASPAELEIMSQNIKNAIQ